MSQTLLHKSNASPSYFNKDTLIGLLIAGPIGAVIGAFIGHSRLDDEQKTGKVVTDKPSFWNKDTLLGGLLGNIAGGIAASVAFIAITGVTLTAAASGVVALAPAMMGAGVLAGAALVLGGIVAGVNIGGKAGQARLEREYEEAKHQTIVEHLSHTVSPEVGKAVEYSLEHNKEWGKQAAEDRLLAAASLDHGR